MSDKVDLKRVTTNERRLNSKSKIGADGYGDLGRYAGASGGGLLRCSRRLRRSGCWLRGRAGGLCRRSCGLRGRRCGCTGRQGSNRHRQGQEECKGPSGLHLLSPLEWHLVPFQYFPHWIRRRTTDRGHGLLALHPPLPWHETPRCGLSHCVRCSRHLSRT